MRRGRQEWHHFPGQQLCHPCLPSSVCESWLHRELHPEIIGQRREMPRGRPFPHFWKQRIREAHAHGAVSGPQLTLAAKPCLAPGLEIAYLQTSEFISVAKFDFPSDSSPSLPRTCPSGQGCGNSCDSVPCRRVPGPGSMGVAPSLHSASFAVHCQCSEKGPPLPNLHKNAE